MSEAFRIQKFGTTDVSKYDPRDYNGEMMVVNTVNSWKDRPDAITKIPNLFLASDYVRTYTDLATMEAANEAARRAVNGILATSGWDKEKENKGKICKVWKLREPWIFLPVKWYDSYAFSKNPDSKFYIPWWIKIIMIPWSIAYFIYSTIKIIAFKVLGIKPK